MYWLSLVAEEELAMLREDYRGQERRPIFTSAIRQIVSSIIHGIPRVALYPGELVWCSTLEA
jgi:hypothetical protein